MHTAGRAAAEKMLEATGPTYDGVYKATGNIIDKLTEWFGGQKPTASVYSPPPHSTLVVPNNTDDAVHVAVAFHDSNDNSWAAQAWWQLCPQHLLSLDFTEDSGDPYTGQVYYHIRGKPIHTGLWIQRHNKIMGAGQEFWVPKSVESWQTISYSLLKPIDFPEKVAKVHFDPINLALAARDKGYYHPYYNG
jgi:hypothetical protein